MEPWRKRFHHSITSSLEKRRKKSPKPRNLALRDSNLIKTRSTRKLIKKDGSSLPPASGDIAEGGVRGTNGDGGRSGGGGDNELRALTAIPCKQFVSVKASKRI